MGERWSARWRQFYQRFKGLAIVGAVGVAFAAGLAGWWLTDNTLSLPEVLYKTLSLFALNFDTDRPIHWLLEVARFLAALVTYGAAIAVAYRVISRGSPLRRAFRLRRHVVVLGASDEATTLAERFRDQGRDVVLVGAPAASDLDRLARRHVVTVPAEPPDRDLSKIVRGAERVVVAGAGESSARLADALHRCPDRPPTTVLFDHRDLAARWSGQGDVALCRTTQVAITLLRTHPPFLERAMVPPPIVVGEGDLAAEIVRRIVVGWQQPGERVTVHCLGRDDSWVIAARAGLSDAADLRLVQVPPSADQLRHAASGLVAAWPRPQKADRFTLAGPSVYVTYPDAVTTVTVTSALADQLRGGDLPDARVVGLVDDKATWMDTLTPSAARLVSRRSLLGDPATLELDPRTLLAGEIVADAARWPGHVPTALGRVVPGISGAATLDAQPPAVRDAVLAVASGAEQILAAGGVRLEQRAWAPDTVFLLAPQQVSAVADALGAALGAPASDREARLRLLELAARMPILAVRAGWTPMAAAGAAQPLTAAVLQRFAVMAHAGYGEVAEATHNGTKSVNFGKDWADLAEVDQRSNIAQVADIPVKLATLGLTWRAASGPNPGAFAFTAEQVEPLAENEHRRWAHFQYRNGRPGHEWNIPWSALTEDTKEYDRNAVRLIPLMLASVGLEIVPVGEHAPATA